ncbi:MAG: RHS repeat-associated core domain-containing protein [Paracoccus sp. (in: a-proteobacteria)]|nr:RHS repeat-associated core domain-containing protein [Paracoccus sp. (in: a-proteobacteria)]
MGLLDYSMRVAGQNSAHLMGLDGQTDATTGDGGGYISPQMQQAMENQADARSGGERAWDDALTFMESPGVQYSVMTAGAVAAMVKGGMGMVACATAAGGTATAGTFALGAAGPLIPILAGVAAGFAGHAIGSWAGDRIGAAMGLEPLSGPSEQPACVGDKIYHAPSGLVSALMGAAVVLGALAAIGAAAALTAATGGAAAPLLVATVAFVAGGLVGGAFMGAAGSLGSQGEEKGEIAVGSPNVCFEGKPVAHVTSIVNCRDHGAAKAVAQGSETVFANGFPIARKGHKTNCDGTIQTGRETVLMDLTTSAAQLDIDGGWLNRLTRSAVVLADFLPFPRGGKRPRSGNSPQTPPRPAGGQTTRPPRFPTLSAAARGVNNFFLRLEGDPVDVASGQVCEFRTDLTIPGTIPLVLERSYRRGATGIQGNDWSGTWAQHLRLEGEAIIYQDPDGVEFTFEAPENDVWALNLRCPHLELAGTRSGELYLFDHRSQLFTLFNTRRGGHVLLTGFQDRNGNEIRLHYGENGLASVTHSDGFQLVVDSENMLIRHATLVGRDADDCVFTWQYDSAGRLLRVDSAQAGHLRYGYDEGGRLAMWADSQLTRAYFAYDSDDRVIRNWSDSGHLSVELSYDLAERRTRVTDAAGILRIYDWTERGLVWRETDPAGGEWRTDWGPSCEILARIDPLGARWSYDYDDYVNLIRVTDPDGRSEQWEYGPDRLPSAHIDAGGARSVYRYDDRGNLVALIGPDGAQRILRRDTRGRITRIDHPLNRQERIYYDALGRPARLQSVAGRETRLTHDTEGRLLSVTDEIGAETIFEVRRGPANPRGAIAAVTRADSTRVSARRNSEGLVTSVTDGEGHSREFRFGAFDLPLETRDALGNRVRLEHDHALRLTAVINEMGQRYELAYDASGNLVAERDYAGLVTRYGHDAAGRLIARIAPDGVVTRFVWSPGGLLLQAGTGEGPGAGVTEYAYDTAGRVTRIADGTSVIEFAYDETGRLIREVVDGRSLTHDYEPGSSLRIARGGDGLALAAEFSAGGDLDALHFAGQALRFGRDARGLEVLRQSEAGYALAQGWTVTRQLAEQMAGPVSALTPDARAGMLAAGPWAVGGSAAGVRARRSYDWDRAGRAIAITDANAGETRLSYDARGLVGATAQRQSAGAAPVLRQFDYDPSRNLVALAEDMRVERVEQEKGRIRQRGRIHYRHDSRGRVIEKRVEEPGFRPRIWAMTWDLRDRLVRLEAPDGAVWRYDYDPLDRRIRRLRVITGGAAAPAAPDRPQAVPKDAAAAAMQRAGSAYQWDGDRIIAEAPLYADGTVAWDRAEHWIYEPGSFRPMARVMDGEVQHIVTDHLGTPREMLSDDGETVLWRAEPGLWGRLDRVERAANENCPIRFQGQWEDAESGLYYNRFRYYDPDATQYLSPDPIGLDGGIRPQGYVDDPNGYVDPLGLAGCSTRLRANLNEEMGLPRSTAWPGYQAQHLVPGALSNHPTIRHAGIDIDAAANGMPLPNRRAPISPMTRHQGSHPGYNRAVDAALDRIGTNRSRQDTASELGRLQDLLRRHQQNGLPIRSSDMSRDTAQGTQRVFEMWDKLLRNAGF